MARALKPYQKSIATYSSATQVRVTLPIPAPGESEFVEFEKYGLRVLVERVEQETQEQIRSRFVTVAPTRGGDTHAARLGTGAVKPKKMGVTLCSENREDPVQSGPRLTGLNADSVTCYTCRKRMASEGVDIVVDIRSTEEGSAS